MRLNSNWSIVSKSVKVGRYNEERLLFPEMEQAKRLGLHKPCPACSTINFIVFRKPVLNKEKERVISSINWVTCSKCNLSYGLES